MKIALLHLDVAEGPETRNRKGIISTGSFCVNHFFINLINDETV